MLNQDQLDHYKKDWINAINNREVLFFEDIFDQDVEMVSAYLLKLIPDSNGKLKGKATLLKYLEMIYKASPDRKLEITSEAILGDRIMYEVLDLSKNKKGLMGFTFNQKGKVIKILAQLD